MKISATSALVLNWTSKDIWQTENAISYIQNLDVSEGNDLLQLFNDEDHYMHTQAVSGRKHFVKKSAIHFLSNLEKKNLTGQVIILGAGIAPMSVEIASLFPSAKVFDVDKYLMNQKEEFVNSKPSNIKFIECDINDIEDLNNQLLAKDFKPDVPTLVVMEGIVYYITTTQLLNIFKHFKKYNSAFACDFCLKPELVNERTRKFLVDVFAKISKEINLDFIRFYSDEEFTELFNKAGYKTVNSTVMQQIQFERTGSEFPFPDKNSSWVHLVLAE